MPTHFYKHKIENLFSVSKIVTVHYLEYPANYVFNGESHDFWEIVYIDRGKVFIGRDEEAESTLRQGQMTFHRPDEFHKIRADGVLPANVFVISFDMRPYSFGYFNGLTVTATKSQQTMISGMMAEAKKTFHMPPFDPHIKKLERRADAPAGGMQMIRLYLEMLLIDILRGGITSDAAPVVLVRDGDREAALSESILAFLTESVEKKLTLSDVCAHFHYGKTYLSKSYKNQTGESIMQSFTRIKVERAKQLIREGRLNFSEIAAVLAFESYAHFSRTFKAMTRLSPKDYARLLNL